MADDEAVAAEIRDARVDRGLIGLDIERLERVDAEKIDGVTIPKGTINIMWTIQTSSLIVVIISLGAMFMQLRFVMVPTLMAYFFTYMMGPVLDLLEKRPYGCFGPCGALPEEPNLWEDAYGSKMLCVAGYP